MHGFIKLKILEENTELEYLDVPREKKLRKIVVEFLLVAV
jgi:hypothetical protein